MVKKRTAKSKKDAAEQRKSKVGYKHPLEEKPLKTKEIAFIENYVANGENGTQAVLETPGFTASTPNSAGVIANRLLRNVKIQARIERRKAELQAKLEEQTEITRAHLVQEYGENLRRARHECQLAAANSAVAGQAKLLGYDAPQQGPGGDIGTVNIIVFGQSDQRKQIESRVVDNQ